MNKEITISIEEYKDLIRCKTIVELNRPTGMIISSDTEVTFTSFKDVLPVNKKNFPMDYGTPLKNHCSKCYSTSHRKGFLGLFGERVCDNKQCENSKSKFL